MPPISFNVWTKISKTEAGAGFMNVLVAAITLGIAAIVESISVGRVFASRDGYTIDGNREMIGLGMANLLGSGFSCYPVGGGLVRSSVAYSARARSLFYSLVTEGESSGHAVGIGSGRPTQPRLSPAAVIVIVVLAALTPVFEKMPMVALAAVVDVGVLPLIEFDQARP